MKKISIELKNIYKSFGQKKVLDDINLNIYDHDSLTIVGMGGSGKTTLLKVAGLIIKPSLGKVYYQGKDTAHLSKKELLEIKSKIGFLFQNHALFDSLSIEENVGFYLKMHKKNTNDEIHIKTKQILDYVNLSDIGNKKISDLSGGMKKRVALARAMIHEPSILFLDDPDAGLDPITSDTISQLLLRLQKKFKTTYVTVTNNLNCIYKLSKRVLFLHDQQIVQLSSRDDFFNNPNDISKQFIQGNQHGPIYINMR